MKTLVDPRYNSVVGKSNHPVRTNGSPPPGRMNQQQVRDLLERVKEGKLSLDQAEDQLASILSRPPFEDLGFARVDHDRPARTGGPEVVYGAGKTPDQIAAIAERLVSAGQNLLVTRTDEAAYSVVRKAVPDATFHPMARAITRVLPASPTGRGMVLIVAAGTSDLSVAEEARISAEALGNETDTLYDVGVAGLHRLLAERERLETAHVIIAVAGMEGALPSVIGGLVSAPVIAVPTSVGYGASFGGLTALLGMLNSCASGVAVVNIDNGFGGAAMASVINHLA